MYTILNIFLIKKYTLKFQNLHILPVYEQCDIQKINIDPIIFNLSIVWNKIEEHSTQNAKKHNTT